MWWLIGLYIPLQASQFTRVCVYRQWAHSFPFLSLDTAANPSQELAHPHTNQPEQQIKQKHTPPERDLLPKQPAIPHKLAISVHPHQSHRPEPAPPQPPAGRGGRNRTLGQFHESERVRVDLDEIVRERESGGERVDREEEDHVAILDEDLQVVEVGGVAGALRCFLLDCSYLPGSGSV